MRLRISIALIIAFCTINQTAWAAGEYIDVSIGQRSICAIDTANQLECTTLFERDTYAPPMDGTSYTDVSVGQSHACAITTSGTVRCWGDNAFEQLNAPTSSVPFIKISAGGNHTCASDENLRIQCWGLNSNRQTDVPVEDNYGFETPYAGGNGSCGIRESGETICWSTDDRYFQNDASARFTDLFVGAAGSAPHSCGLNQQGRIDCWFTYPHAPTEVPDNGPYIAVESSFAMICGLMQNGRLDCGATQYSSDRLNNTIRTDIATFEALPPLQTFEISATNLSSALCGIDYNSQIVCAGSNLPALNLPGEELRQFPAEDLSVSYYSDTTIELTWSLFISPQRGEIPWSGFNIYRDNELIKFTTNGGSFLDETLQPDVEYVYSIATVDLDGNENGMSNTITVNTNNRNTDEDEGDQQFQSQPAGLTLTRYGDNSLELFWERPESFFGASYRIFRNGKFLAVAPGNSFFDDDASQHENLHYSVVTVKNRTEVSGVAFITAPAETLQCF